MSFEEASTGFSDDHAPLIDDPERLKKSVTIRLDEATIDYFKDLAEKMAVTLERCGLTGA